MVSPVSFPAVVATNEEFTELSAITSDYADLKLVFNCKCRSVHHMDPMNAPSTSFLIQFSQGPLTLFIPSQDKGQGQLYDGVSSGQNYLTIVVSCWIGLLLCGKKGQDIAPMPRLSRTQ